MIAPIHKGGQGGYERREQSAKLTIAAIIRTPEPSGMDREGRQSITVFIPELAMVEGPRAIEVKLPGHHHHPPIQKM